MIRKIRKLRPLDWCFYGGLALVWCLPLLFVIGG